MTAFQKAWYALKKNVSDMPNMPNDPDMDHDPYPYYQPNALLQQGARNTGYSVPTTPEQLRIEAAMARRTQARPTGPTSDFYGQAFKQNMNDELNQSLGTNVPTPTSAGVGKLTDEQIQQILSNTGNFGGF